jgi:hypothetical protein
MREQLCMQGLGVAACFLLECCYLIYSRCTRGHNSSWVAVDGHIEKNACVSLKVGAKVVVSHSSAVQQDLPSW